MTEARKPPITIKEVAEAAGVHFSTVSRALNPATRRLVKPLIVARVTEAARRLGYRANSAASSLRTRRSKMVGLVIPDLRSMLFPSILDGIEDEFLQSGYMTIIGNTANDAEREKRILSGLIERQVDGLIIATATRDDPAIFEWIGDRIPVVLLNRTDEAGSAPAVLQDDMLGVALAVEHLVTLGHQRLAHIAGPTSLSTGAARLRGFRLACSEMLPAIDSPTVVEAPIFSREAGRMACLELLERAPSVTGIIAANDLLALGCYDALAESGLKCPADISITGYNNTAFSDLVRPALTTIEISQREMGVEAARLLTSLMAGEKRTANTVLRPSLIVRQSTAAPRH